MAALNLKQFIEPQFNGFDNSIHPFDYPSNAIQARKAKDKGSSLFYVHPYWGSRSLSDFRRKSFVFNNSDFLA